MTNFECVYNNTTLMEIMPMKNNFPFNDTSLDLESRVKNLIGNLTLEEKISLIPTQQAAVPRLGIEA